MSINRRTVGLMLVAFLFVAGFIIHWLYAYNRTSKEKALIKNGLVGPCLIVSIEKGSRYRNSVCYSFSRGFTGYRDCELYRLSDELKAKLPGSGARVIFLKDKPEVNKLLLFREDFQEYGVSYPDSLSWIDSLR